LIPWIVAVVAVVVVEGLYHFGPLALAEERVADLWHVLAPAPAEEPKVVLVAVDDQTLDKLDDPILFWAPHFAASIASLRSAGATVVGLDFQFQASAEEWLARSELGDVAISRTWDAPLRAEVFEGGVVLAASVVRDDQGRVAYDLPLGPYLALLPDRDRSLGLVDLPLDGDDVVRRYQPVPVASEQGPSLSFGLTLVANHLGLDPRADTWNVAGQVLDRSGEGRRIRWLGSAGSVPQVPFWRLVIPGALRPEDREKIRGRVAVVGVTHKRSADRFITPLRWGDDPTMPGAEVHANVVASILRGDRLQLVPDVWRCLLLLLVTSIVSSVVFRTRVRVGLLVVVGSVLAWPLAALCVFAIGGLLVPTVSGMLAIALVLSASYPLRFSGEQKDRARLNGLFRRYLSDDVVQEILARPDALQLGGVRLDLSVLVVDVRGFTTLSEALEPEEVVELLNRWLGPACQPILDQGGVVDKFLGDGILAVFGAPVPREDHARRALVAAVGIAAAADGMQAWCDERFADRGIGAFSIGVGVHSGPAVSGTIGFELRSEYTVIGDTVNTASRIEGLCKQADCRLLVSRAAADAAGPGFSYGRVTELPVKGKAQQVEVLELLGLVEPGAPAD